MEAEVQPILACEDQHGGFQVVISINEGFYTVAKGSGWVRLRFESLRTIIDRYKSAEEDSSIRDWKRGIVERQTACVRPSMRNFERFLR